MGKIVSSVLGGGDNKAAVAEAERARQVQERIAAEEKAAREAQKNMEQNAKSLSDPTGTQTANVVAGGSADIAETMSEQKKKKSLSGGLASAVGLNI